MWINISVSRAIQLLVCTKDSEFCTDSVICKCCKRGVSLAYLENILLPYLLNEENSKFHTYSIPCFKQGFNNLMLTKCTPLSGIYANTILIKQWLLPIIIIKLNQFPWRHLNKAAVPFHHVTFLYFSVSHFCTSNNILHLCGNFLIWPASLLCSHKPHWVVLEVPRGHRSSYVKPLHFLICHKKSL